LGKKNGGFVRERLLKREAPVTPPKLPLGGGKKEIPQKKVKIFKPPNFPKGKTKGKLSEKK